MTLLALLFMGYLLSSQWQELATHQWSLNGGWLALSALGLAAAWAVEVALWWLLLRLIGGRIPYWAAVRIWFLSAVVRYIPGNVWQPLSMTLQAGRWGVRPEITLPSIALYQLTIVLATAPIAALYVGATGNWGLLTQWLGPWTAWLAALVMLPVLLFLLRPVWLIEIFNWVLVRVGRQPLIAQLSRGMLLLLLLIAMLDWLLWGAAFAALAFAVTAFSPDEMRALLPHLVAAYSVAYTIGFLSIVTPSGLGVREGAFYLILAPVMGGGIVTVTALAMRLWTTLGELVAAGGALLLHDRPAPALSDGAAMTEPGPAPAKQ
jgi:glycosyltransferase 2 family protein